MRSNLKPPRSCIFCGNGGVSKEHVWSEWTYKYLPKRHGYRRENEFRGAGEFMRLENTKDFEGEPNTLKIKAPCKVCNNGWMSTLERKVKPILIPLMQGEATALSEVSQKTLATWVVVKCMVAEHGSPDDTVVSTEDERKYLKDRQEPPPTWKVWIAHQNGTEWRTGHTHAVGTLGSSNVLGQPPVTPDGTFAKNTQSVTFGFGSLLIHAFSTRVVGVDINPGPNVAHYFTRIYPISSDMLWPNTPAIPDDMIDAIAFSLPRFAAGLPWQPAG